MSGGLYSLMEAGILTPLSYYFARFFARGSGVALDSMLGVTAALVSQRNLQGDVCVDLSQYAGRPLFEARDAAAVPLGPGLAEWLAILTGADWVGAPGVEAPLILDGRRLYLHKYWRFEQSVAKALAGRLGPVAGLDLARLAEGLDRLFPTETPHALDWQKIGAAIAVGRGFSVISGGPGTGKTTTVVKVLALLLEQNPKLRVALAAPTGKAAARLSDAVRRGKGRVRTDADRLSAIPIEASTIHRLLEVRFGGRFGRHRDNPLAVDCLVVDEASMVDLPLMTRLLEALPEGARVILLGDRDQLASVEAGSVLGDITGHGREIRYTPEQLAFLEGVGAVTVGGLDSGGECPPVADAVALLRCSYRFGAGSGIGSLARTVNAGRGDRALALLDDPALVDIVWLDAAADRLNRWCLDWAVERYAVYLGSGDVAAALSAFERSRVLTALHRGPFGADEIDRMIAGELQARGLIKGGEEYHGKPVMVTTNDYEVGLFNGDIGLLWRGGDGVLRAYFLVGEGQVRSVPVRQLPEHVCAYALTVHKSQGSEFDEVLLLLPFESSPIVSRELIYTGVTRARRRVTIQGHRETFVEGCRRQVRRSSALAEKLGWPPLATR
jgi:exodeoxyribonuclease V alpha subunit